MRVSIGLTDGSRLLEAIDVLAVAYDLDFPSDGDRRFCLRMRAGCNADERSGETDFQPAVPTREQGKGLLQ